MIPVGLQSIFAQNMGSFLAVAGILIVGIVGATVFKRACLRWVPETHNPSLKHFLVNLIYAACLIVVAIIALGKLGVPTASLVTVLGAASLSISLAMKDFLSNIAAGFTVLFSRPFKVGDTIEVSGTMGTVTKINLFVTQLKTKLNEAIFIPNNKIVGEKILNKTFYPVRRYDLPISIDFKTDIQKVKTLLEDALKQCEVVQQDPAFLVAVSGLNDSGISLTIKVFVKRDNYLRSTYTVLEKVIETLNAHDIIPLYPQMDVHLHQDV
ncbi:MAG: mechanosensitive ion channel protein [marine bacterium B5-7]|nr:MAG: mechanosensitive ion channel protein [marine bacterium B5-7]